MEIPNIIREWKKMDLSQSPFVLERDKGKVNSNKNSLIYKSFEDFIENLAEVKKNNNKYHLGLLPIPYLGDIQKAKIFILMANPGLGASDYKGEYYDEEYKTLLINNLRQEITGEYPFFSLNPKLAWHGGFEYWENKFSEIIDEIMLSSSKSYEEVLKFIARNIASLELIPYHSINSRFVQNLYSSKIMLDYVKNYLVPRAEKNETLIIVTRKAKEWGLGDKAKEFEKAGIRSICIYSKGQARSASLSRKSEGGKRIIEFLKLYLDQQ